jgi:heme-degrading monooxygenase HmoA
MVTVQVELRIKPGSEQMLQKVFCETFRPAISHQEGFRDVALLVPRDNAGNYVLSLAFENHSLQQKWVASDLHQAVWGQIEGLCGGYSVKTYDAV